MKNQKTTQKEQVKTHLKTYKSITTWEAIKLYRITRLSEYIRLLRKEMRIDSLPAESNGKHFVTYKYKRSGF